MADVFKFGTAHLYVTKANRVFQTQTDFLRDLFAHFLPTSISSQNAVCLRLSRGRHTNFLKNAIPLFSTPLCDVYQKGPYRICQYGPEHQVVIRKHRGQIKVSVQGPSDELTDEILYLLMLSFSGELLDQQGWHRIHSAGVTKNSIASVYPRASLYGKSNYILHCLENKDVQILGDENVLTNGFQVQPFASTVHLKSDRLEKTNSPYYWTRRSKKLWGERFLFRIPADRVSAPVRSFNLYFNSTSRMLWFCVEFPLGLGVVQMREFMIRPDNLLKLPFIFLSRLRTLFLLMPRMKIGDFSTSSAPILRREPHA